VLCRDPLWLAGTIAYWCEGSKTCNDVRFANADVGLIRVFIAWSTRFLERGPDRMSCQLHLHDGQEPELEIQVWSDATGIPTQRFVKPFFKPSGTGHRRQRLEHGVALIRVQRSTDAFHRISGWIDALPDLMTASTPRPDPL